ncbi:putative plant self-incompatibility S1 [Helianthus annuus]|nr:putative plant self-incompatibility S1 [Helianthus annuus]
MHHFLLYIILTSSLISITNSCFFTPKWNVYLINDTPDSFAAHVMSKDDDLGNHIVPPNANYYFSFCDRWDRTSQFDAEFWWDKKYQCLGVVNDFARSKCHWLARCYWLVRPEGFYVSMYNVSFPRPEWTFVKSWG